MYMYGLYVYTFITGPQSITINKGKIRKNNTAECRVKCVHWVPL